MSAVMMPPLGPRLYCFMTSLYLTVSRMSMLVPNGMLAVAGSRLMT